MKTETKYFGPVEYEQEEVISFFPAGFLALRRKRTF